MDRRFGSGFPAGRRSSRYEKSSKTAEVGLCAILHRVRIVPRGQGSPSPSNNGLDEYQVTPFQAFGLPSGS